RLRVHRQRILHDRMFSRDQLFEKFNIAAIRNDGQTSSNGGTQAAGVIEMMMRHDGMRERFVRTECSCSIDHGQRSQFVQRNFKERQVVVELKENASMISGSRKPPDTFPYFFCSDGHRKCTRRNL